MQLCMLLSVATMYMLEPCLRLFCGCCCCCCWSCQAGRTVPSQTIQLWCTCCLLKCLSRRGLLSLVLTQIALEFERASAASATVSTSSLMLRACSVVDSKQGCSSDSNNNVNNQLAICFGCTELATRLCTGEKRQQEVSVVSTPDTACDKAWCGLRSLLLLVS